MPIVRVEMWLGRTHAQKAELARAITRRAEREASRLRASGYKLNPQVMRLLNRASALLYSLARYEEHAGGSDAPTTHMPNKGGRG